MDGKSTWHQVDSISCSIGYCGRHIKRGMSDTNLGAIATNYIVMSSYKYYIVVGTSTWKYVAIPQYDPLALYTKLEGPSIAKLECFFPMAQPLDNFQGSLGFHSHGFGMCVK